MNNMLVINVNDPNKYNCVKFVRATVKNLPYGLWTLKDKIKIIDTQNPKRGRVAIIKTGIVWGHLAIVTEVCGKKITILEANYKFGKITERTGTKKELNILGFFNPQKKRWNK